MKQILAKLHAIMSEVDRIEKDAKNTHQNYKYASEKIIKETLHAQFVKHKVLFQLSSVNARIAGSVTFVDFNYAFFDVETGEELKGTFIGSGQARDEKGNYAAVTGAIKYILTSTFLIPTGDDPENDRNEAVEEQGKPSNSNQEIESVLDQEESTGLRCEKCGAPAEEKSGTTKAGKAWRGIMCSTQDRTHTRWMYD